MQDTLWLIVSKNQVEKTLKTEPVGSAVTGTQRVVKLIVRVPADAFALPPVPVVEITLTPGQIGTASVIVDGQDIPQSLDEWTAKQRLVQRQLAALLESARRSPDPAMQGAAKSALDALLESGVDVRLVEDAQAENTQEGR